MWKRIIPKSGRMDGFGTGNLTQQKHLYAKVFRFTISEIASPCFAWFAMTVNGDGREEKRFF